MTPPAPLGELIAQYEQILDALWLANLGPGSEETRHDLARLLAEQSKLCDDLGPEIAGAVTRQRARLTSKMWNRCAWCGQAGDLHERESP
jgi:hypothetical protein